MRPNFDAGVQVDFDSQFATFQQDSRTYKVLDLLERQSQLEVDKEADDLLPSVDVLAGYNLQGDGLSIENNDNMIFAGFSMQWPFSDQVDHAEWETAKIELRQVELSSINTDYQLSVTLRNLSTQVQKEDELRKIAETKIKLAKSVLEDEAENYSFGKVSLNDYIDAVNVLDNNRFDLITHDWLYQKLIVEWLQYTDQLIQSHDVPMSQAMSKRSNQ